jgi:(p)ppGpp synthase/HD superfamily hydrolase
VPRLDSIFKSKWKSQGVAMFGMMTDGGRDKWLEFIRRHDLRGWVHGYQTKEMKEADYAANRPNYRQLYDVYQTPMLYLLDKDKRIVAKKLTYQQMDELIQARLKAGGR